MRGGRARRLAPRLAWLAVVAVPLVLLAAGCSAGVEEFPQDAMDPAGPIAREQDALWNLVFPIAVGIFVLVQGALIVAVVRFRKRDDDPSPPRQVEGNTRLELIWTIVPAVILAVVAVPTVRTIFDVAAEPEEALEVRVVAKQFWWEFQYIGEQGQGVVTAHDLHIPTEVPVRLRMESLSPQVPDTVDPRDIEGSERSPAAQAGVIHSFWVPRLAGKQDVVPGHIRSLTLEADEPGVYYGQCAEFCGIGHAEMRLRVIAQQSGEFQSWLDAQAEPAESGLDGLAGEGEALFAERGCVNCHTVRGYEGPEGQVANVRIGPDLTHFASREVFGGALFENDVGGDAENVAAWLRNPPEMKQGAQMPNLGLSEDDIDALVEYLQTLE